MEKQDQKIKRYEEEVEVSTDRCHRNVAKM